MTDMIGIINEINWPEGQVVIDMYDAYEKRHFRTNRNVEFFREQSSHLKVDDLVEVVTDPDTPSEYMGRIRGRRVQNDYLDRFYQTNEPDISEVMSDADVMRWNKYIHLRQAAIDIFYKIAQGKVNWQKEGF